ncbi:MAG: hypothetical protein JW702_07845 [Clostridiales bacterium]|nr:hypothetical protein [Clostridiales bacterium]
MENFNDHWLKKIETNMNIYCDIKFSKQIMKDIYKIPDVLAQTKELLLRMKETLSDDTIHDILTSSACFYPRLELIELNKIYKENKNLKQVHQLLQNKFEKNIVTYKSLTNDELQFIKNNNWGIAGELKDDYIIATKIPSNFQAYFTASSPEEKKSLYCHCPRMKEYLLRGENAPYEYCLCGGGYYRDIWKSITGNDIKVEILQSVLKGDSLCQFKIIINPIL